MVFAIGQRVLPAFSGMRLLFSPLLMFAALLLLAFGCLLRVAAEVLAYQGFLALAWGWLPVSAICEMAAVTAFAVNLLITFTPSPSPHGAVKGQPPMDVTYTQNWPHEPLTGNQPTGGAVVWSVVSFILLLAGIGGIVCVFRPPSRTRASTNSSPPPTPLLGLRPTPSQRATVKFFFVVAALWVVQVALGPMHHPVQEWKARASLASRSITGCLTASIRTWHLQIGLFWIATSWLATGLYVAPAISGLEPKGQRLGVNALFGALLLVVVGSLAGEWLSVEHKLGNLWFWFGTQGYEYVDLGRFWQILLFIGLVFWLWLMWRALKPALARRDQSHSLLLMFLLASIAIPLFYAAGLMYGEHSNLLTAEYWRWWVVHPVGGRLLRSLRHRGHRVPAHYA